MIITIDKINEIREIIEDKKFLYEGIQFDNNGRAVVGQLECNATEELRDLWATIYYKLNRFHDIDKLFRDDLGFVYDRRPSIDGKLISLYNVKSQRMETIKMSKIIARLSKLLVPIAGDMVNDMMKDVSKRLDVVLGKKAQDIYLTINPLDMMLISGGSCDSHLTTFSSCMSTTICETTEGNGDIDIIASGSYANTHSMYRLGKITNRCMLFIKNSNTRMIHDMPIYGYHSRLLAWYDGNKMFLEKCYPSHGMKTDIKNSISNNINIMNKIYEIKELRNADIDGVTEFLDSYPSMYLDYSGIDYNGIHLLPDSRGAYGHGEGYDLPEGNMCENCGCTMHEDDGYFVDGEYFCYDCFHEIFTFCTDCDDIIVMDDSHRFDDEFYCDSCWSDHTN